MWRKETKRVKTTVPVKGASPEMLAMVLQEAGEDAEIEAATPQQVPVMGPGGPMLDPMTGQPAVHTVYDARICTYEERKSVKIEAFPPEELLIKRDWTSPMLDDCPYVAATCASRCRTSTRWGSRTLTADDLNDSDATNQSADKTFRDTRNGTTDDTHASQPTSIPRTNRRPRASCASNTCWWTTTATGSPSAAASIA
jgi:hypothetical protein